MTNDDDDEKFDELEKNSNKNVPLVSTQLYPNLNFLVILIVFEITEEKLNWLFSFTVSLF